MSGAGRHRPGVTGEVQRTELSFCEAHWEQLREAVESRGMEHLVSDGGEEATRRTAAFAEEQTLENFDPLIVAYTELVTASINTFGEALLTEGGCPMCFLAREAPRGWILGCVDSQRAWAVEHGWVEGGNDRTQG